MMMLNTKIGVALLAFVAGTASAATNDADHHNNKRFLRKGRKHRIQTQNQKLDKDITEDVAFWTRSLQSSMPPPTPPNPTPKPQQGPPPPTPSKFLTYHV